jgi:hypothetical protein
MTGVHRFEESTVITIDTVAVDAAHAGWRPATPDSKQAPPARAQARHDSSSKLTGLGRHRPTAHEDQPGGVPPSS